MNYQGRITLDPGKRGGRPCIRGMRISVYDVLEMLASGQSETDILEDFPELETEDIRACLAYAAQPFLEGSGTAASGSEIIHSGGSGERRDFLCRGTSMSRSC